MIDNIVIFNRFCLDFEIYKSFKNKMLKEIFYSNSVMAPMSTLPSAVLS